MKIYTCKDRLEDIMTCIYDAWIEALQIGHDQIQLKKEPIFVFFIQIHLLIQHVLLIVLVHFRCLLFHFLDL